MDNTERAAEDAEALARAQGSQTWSNYPAIYAGFMERGIPETDIEPRVNVFTYRAWRAKGRQVRRGEHGVRITTWIPAKDQPEPDMKGKRKMFPKMATVFHITQTEPRSEP